MAAVAPVEACANLDLDLLICALFKVKLDLGRSTGSGTGLTGFGGAADVDGMRRRPPGGGRRTLLSSLSTSTLFPLAMDSNKASSGLFWMRLSSGCCVLSFWARPWLRMVKRLGVVPGFRSAWIGLGNKISAGSSSLCCCSGCCSSS